jgi:hypothetical protein
MTQPKKVNSNTVQIFGRAVGRNEILARYWELASIDPASTKDSITGQLNALELLWEGLALRPVDDGPLKPNIYRAPWLPPSPNTRPS